MKRWGLSAPRKQIYTHIAWTALIITMTGVIAALIKRLELAESILLGGTAWLLPNLYFARQVFIEMRPQQVKRIIRNFYRAEMIKLFVSALLLTAAISFWAASVGFVLMGYVLAQAAFWLIALVSELKKA